MTRLHEAQRRAEPIVRYVAPASLDEAMVTLAEHGPAARAVAGGTDLLLELSRAARTGIDTLVDLSVLEGLDTITLAGGRVELGPLVTHSDVVGSVLLRRSALPLAQACLEVGSPQLRNRATVVGNIVTASPANDTISALYALGASVTVSSAGGSARTLPIGEFCTGFRSTVLKPGELVSLIAFDALGGTRRGIFVKLGLRRAQAISVVHAAAVVTEFEDGSVADLVVALGSVGPTIELVHEAGTIARGRPLSESAGVVAAAARDAVTPIDDLRSTAEYRRHATEVVVRRALRSLAAGNEAAMWPENPPRLISPTHQISPTALPDHQFSHRADTTDSVTPDALTTAAHGHDGPINGRCPDAGTPDVLTTSTPTEPLTDADSPNRHETPPSPSAKTANQSLTDADAGFLQEHPETARAANQSLQDADINGLASNTPDTGTASQSPTDANCELRHGRVHRVRTDNQTLTDADTIACNVNGVERSGRNAAGRTLLDWLRFDLGLTGTKEGCAEGECGACTVHLDGQAVLACLVPAGQAAGADIVTVEGIAAPGGALHPVQQALADCGGVQCGFCTPGFVMSAVMLAAENPNPSRAQVEHGLAGNLCRCTGYYSIIEALVGTGDDPLPATEPAMP